MYACMCFLLDYAMYVFLAIHVGAVYFMLGNIHPGLRSRLEAINLVCLFPYSLLAVHSFDEILRPLIADIKTLQEVSEL